MSSLLGSLIQRTDGVSGVIVNATADSMWRNGQAFVYDIVWEDKSYERKVMPETIYKLGWKLQSRKVDPVECNRIWAEFQVERVRQMTARYAGGGASQPIAHPIEVNRQKRLDPAPVVQPPIVASSIVRPASWHARQLLSAAMPGVAFAVSMDRRRLSIGWLDGPVEPRVAQVLAVLQHQGLIEKVLLRRGAQAHFLHAAIEYVVGRVWGDLSSPGASADLLRMTPADFQSHLMGSAMTPPACPLGATPYNGLIRCVIDRWDDDLGEFQDTDRTRYLMQERSFLFPGGDRRASVTFGDMVYRAKSRVNDAKEYAENLSLIERTRG